MSKKKKEIFTGDVKEDVMNLHKQAKKKTVGFWSAFKAFAFKGNVLDMAVGVVVGSAFTAIVNSLVGDLITPLISLLTGGVDFSELKWVIRETIMDGEEVVKEGLTVNYGNLLNAVINFFLIALSVFLVVKILTIKKEKETAEAAEKKAKEEEEAKAKAEEEAKVKAEADAAAAAAVEAQKKHNTELLEAILEELKKK